MSLDAEIRSVARALPHMDESQRAFFAEATFAMLRTMPEMRERLEVEARAIWPLMDDTQWASLRDAFWAETERRAVVADEARRLERVRAAEERRAQEAARRAAFEASAIVVAPLERLTQKLQDWSRFDLNFGEVGIGQHLVMPTGYGPREVNSLRAYLKRHFPRLAVSTRANSLGNETYVYRKEKL